jgi:hypothetical protein
MRYHLADLCVHTQDFLVALDGPHLPPNLRRVKIRSRTRLSSCLREQDIVHSMRTNLPLPHALVRTVEHRGFRYVYKWLTRDGIADDATVDPRTQIIDN